MSAIRRASCGTVKQRKRSSFIRCGRKAGRASIKIEYKSSAARCSRIIVAHEPSRTHGPRSDHWQQSQRSRQGRSCRDFNEAKLRSGQLRASDKRGSRKDPRSSSISCADWDVNSTAAWPSCPQVTPHPFTCQCQIVISGVEWVRGANRRPCLVIGSGVRRRPPHMIGVVTESAANT